MISRNAKCFCGSEKRYKHCHGVWSVNTLSAPIGNWHTTPIHARDSFDRAQVERVAHFDQYGFHRPMMVTGDDEIRFIVRGEKIIVWEGGKHFLNFLQGDLLRELGESFREDERHPLHGWWIAMQAQAAARISLGPERGLISTVAVLSFFTTAYDLFVLADNAKPRERLVRALRIPDQFHGARYELMIAACLVRAGFNFTFSDEEDCSSAHSDGVAVHRRTGKRYAVEMKTKGRPGILGKAGERPPQAAMKGDVSRQLRDALLKPAHDERLIFIDLNLPPPPSGWQGKGVRWSRDAIASKRAVEEQPGNAPADATGFIVFTNMPSNQMAHDEFYVGLEMAFTAYNKPDFAADMPLLGDAYPDIADLFKAFANHDQMPQTF
jgi:hypothetical protein